MKTTPAILMLAVGVGLLLGACNQTPGVIVFPSAGATLHNPVRLEATTAGEWFANGTRLGHGRSWSGELTPGVYTVKLDGLGQGVAFEVLEDFPLNQPRAVATTKTLNLPSGRFAVLWGNTNPQPIASGLETSAVQTATIASEKLQPLQGLETRLTRQVRTVLDARTKAAGLNRPNLQAPGLQAQSVNQPTLGSMRDFKMLNLDSIGSDTIQAELLQVNAHSLVYLEHTTDMPVNNDLSDAVLGVAAAFENHIHARVSTFFGTSADVDQNNRVILLFSPRLNASKLAVGFFAPVDMLQHSDDNPDSNEAEVLYLGVPTANDANFSPGSISATACHEYQHLVNFSNKTLPYAGGPDAPLEDTALNEGLSHLAEDLCGYNRLGGNVVFAARYLQRPETTSLDGTDTLGRGDSIERRGAMYLFLRHQMERHGPHFLKTVLTSPEVGLENLASTLGVPLETMIWQAWWAAQLEPSFQSTTLQGFALPQPDPITGDQTGINTHAGAVFLPPSLTVALKGPKTLVAWPKTLPARGVAYQVVTGPSELELPVSGTVNVMRVQ